MADTYRIPQGWSVVAEDPNHHVYEQDSWFGSSEELHVVAHTGRGTWQAQVHSGAMFRENEEATLGRYDTKQKAMQKAVQYMRQN